MFNARSVQRNQKAYIYQGRGFDNRVRAWDGRLMSPSTRRERYGSSDCRSSSGLQIEFQIVPGTEAPAEMNFFFPDHNALLIAECATHFLHNIITLRGALVRDAKAWASCRDETLVLYGGRSDV